jgi:hypothetical protein
MDISGVLGRVQLFRGTVSNWPYEVQFFLRGEVVTFPCSESELNACEPTMEEVAEWMLHELSG